MFNKPKKETTTYGIIGLGRFGYALAEELASSGAELLVLERDEEKVRGNQGNYRKCPGGKKPGQEVAPRVRNPEL